MSGICGIYSPTVALQASQEILNKMLEAIDPLSPNARRSFVDQEAGVALGRIVSPAIQRQKYEEDLNWKEDKNHVATLDGVIFNSTDFIPTRRQFARNDCAVCASLEYLRQAPLDFPDQLDGQFNLTIWGKKQKELWLVHNGMGSKPLYYAYILKAVLIFSSELKGILVHPAFKSSMNQKALSSYLTFGYVPAPLSLLEGIHKIFRDEVLRIKGDGQMTRRQFGMPHKQMGSKREFQTLRGKMK